MSLKKLNNDYLTQKDKIIIFVKLYVIFFLIGYLFYENIFLAILFGFTSTLIYQNQIKEKNKKIKDEIIEKFNEFINIFDSYISSGDEPNYAFVSAYKEYKNICTNNYIISSLEKASNYIDVYNDFLNAILKFKNEMNIEIINKFYDSINIAYTSLGDINYILKSTIAVISNKIILTKEIENIYHEKKYELKVMLAIPILMFGILNLTAKDFISPMYQSLTGYMIITLCLALLIGAYFIGEYIMRIDIE